MCKRWKKLSILRECTDRESAFNHVHQEIVASSDEEFGEAEDDGPSFSVRMSSPVAADSVPQKTISDKAREFAIENVSLSKGAQSIRGILIEHLCRNGASIWLCRTRQAIPRVQKMSAPPLDSRDTIRKVLLQGL